jgi:hypothetical protein
VGLETLSKMFEGDAHEPSLVYDKDNIIYLSTRKEAIGEVRPTAKASIVVSDVANAFFFGPCSLPGRAKAAALHTTNAC